MSDQSKDDQREIARLREGRSNLVKELRESREAHLKDQRALWGIYEIMETLPGLLQSHPDSEEGYSGAWDFLEKLLQTNRSAALALGGVVVGWVRQLAESGNQEDIIRTVDILITQLENIAPVTTVRVQ